VREFLSLCCVVEGEKEERKGLLLLLEWSREQTLDLDSSLASTSEEEVSPFPLSF
jgi:hypothetical protein